MSSPFSSLKRLYENRARALHSLSTCLSLCVLHFISFVGSSVTTSIYLLLSSVPFCTLPPSLSCRHRWAQRLVCANCLTRASWINRYRTAECVSIYTSPPCIVSRTVLKCKGPLSTVIDSCHRRTGGATVHSTLDFCTKIEGLHAL